MEGSYDLQKWLMEYSNDSLDFSPVGLAVECVEFLESLDRYVQAANNIEQEAKAELHKDFEQLKHKLNQLIKSVSK